MKCCSRRSRVAPAEAAVCCPPERRFGAICRRLFDNCKCKRNAEAERARSIRAKHSLTSVAPPPLSEVTSKLTTKEEKELAGSLYQLRSTDRCSISILVANAQFLQFYSQTWNYTLSEMWNHCMHKSRQPLLRWIFIFKKYKNYIELHRLRWYITFFK